MSSSPFPLCEADPATFWPWLTWTDYAQLSAKESFLVVVPIVGMAEWGLDAPLAAEETVLMPVLAVASRRCSPAVRLLVVPPLRFVAGPAARLGTIENAARKVGWELRCYPSTWVKASIGGFVGGGSGGIGSIGWGGLSAPGTIKRFKLLTIEESPQVLTLNEAEALSAFHAYGTNGLIVEIQMRLGPAYSWDQMVIAGKDWDGLLSFADEIARDDGVRKRLVTVLETPIPSFFKPIRKFYPADHHLVFLEVEADKTAEVRSRAEAAGLAVSHVIPHHEPRRSPMLSDYTWNHTTLWAINTDESYTYIQSGFGTDFREQFRLLHARFPGEILFHLEFTRDMQAGGSPGKTVVGGIPIVKFTDEARLKEIIEYCREIGVTIADPHTCYVDEGWSGADWSPHLALKARTDPFGLLNPGKFAQAARPPFDPSGARMPKFLFTA